MHRIVSELYELHPFDVSEAVFFNVDELTNLPRSYAGGPVMEPPFLWAKGDSSPTILSFPVCPGFAG